MSENVASALKQSIRNLYDCNYSNEFITRKAELLADNDEQALDLIKSFNNRIFYRNKWAGHALISVTKDTKDAYIKTIDRIISSKHYFLYELNASLLYDAYINHADEKIIEFISENNYDYDDSKELRAIIYNDRRFHDAIYHADATLSALKLINDYNMVSRMIPKSIITYLINHDSLYDYYNQLVELAYDVNRMNTDVKYYDDIMSTVSIQDMMNDIRYAYSDYQYEINNNEYVNYAYCPYHYFEAPADYSHQNDDALYVYIMMLMNDADYMMEDYICYAYMYWLYTNDYENADDETTKEFAFTHNYHAMRTYVECIMNGYPNEFARENALYQLHSRQQIK